jgi:asparagine synthase (glutamine-hydrolysing)
MCGIFAVMSRAGPISDETMSAGVARLAHRGPDGQRYWISPERAIGLGHARLAVIDLATGDQPMASEDGLINAVVNGEFYDYRRIRRALEARGHHLRTQSDSEIVVHLWEDQRVDCLAQLRGEFAFLLWDARDGVLVAARDRFGVKPLYYTEYDDRLYFASEAKSLFAVGVPARWDRESFFQMCHLYYPQGRTLFAGVYQVPPGHYLLATQQGTSLVKYWDLDYPRRNASQPERTAGEHVDRLRDALEEAVRLRLQADVPVACYLSGGLDSSTILGMAARQTATPIEAFTVAFDAESYDESSIAADTARHAGANHHILSVTQDQIADHFADAVWHSETINPNTNGVAKYLLSEHVRRAGFKAVLTGEGGDEAAMGYDFLVRDMLLYSGKECPRRERGLRDLTGLGLPSGEGGVSTAVVRERLGFVPSWVTWFAEAAAHSRALWSASFRSEFARCDPYRAFLDALDFEGQLADREPVYQSLYLWNKSMFLNLLLNQLADRMEMAHAIEGRVPFLDDRVVELLREMPVSLKIRAATGKHVLREAARPYVTGTVYKRRKQAFLAPPPSLQPNGPLHRMLQDLLRSSSMAAVPFFDHRAVVRFVDLIPRLCAQSPRALVGVGNQLVYLASACVLQTRFALAS